MAEQSDWRFCVNCQVLFFNGFSSKGKCPATSSGHVAAGFNFIIPLGNMETPNAQPKWRNCQKCQVMFFDGFPDKKGKCPVDGAGHTVFPNSFEFLIPRDMPETMDAQAEWRNCEKCQAMFFDGRPQKGVCPVDGAGHTVFPNSFHFVLPHPINPRIFLSRDANLVRIFGASFTPDEQVSIVWQYKSGNSLNTNVDSPAIATTETNGIFGNTTISLQPNPANLSVQATDRRTKRLTTAFHPLG